MIRRVFLTSLVLSLLITQSALAQISVSPKNSDERDFNLEIEAGSETTASLAITNLLDKETIVKVYAVDASQSKDGALAFTTLASTQKAIGLWTKASEEKIRIGKGETKEMEFKVSVPASASPGTYVGAIAAEEIDSNSTSEKQVNISARVVTKIYVKVPGEINHKYKWENLKIDKTNKNINFTLDNLGNSLVTAEGEFIITNLLSGQQNKIKINNINLFAHENKQISAPWKDVPSFGWIKVQGQLTFGKYDFLTRKSIDKQTETQETTILLIPTAVKNSILFIVLLIIALVSLRYYQKHRQTQNLKTYKTGKGETLNTIATKFKIDWQELVKVNNLKAPYTIRPNDTLFIPNAKKQKSK